MQEGYIETIALMAYKLKLENPSLTNDEAIEISVESFFNSQIELAKQLVQIKNKIGEQSWQELVKIFSQRKKSPKELKVIYNRMINENNLIDGITITSLELSVEYEGTNIPRIFPPATKVKISKDIWDKNLEYIEVWTSPNSVDYCLRQNVLAL
ncbi:MAG: hypothetical protein HC815_05795 [Richelia sp. RM1_1_1]|nr:hypothetical protein [Richelia sp. RM1_1_1]